MASKKLLLVDTNVISHALSPNQIQCYVELFSQLEKEYRFIVTGFTKYELLRSSDKKHKESIEEYLTQNMATVDLSDVLIGFTSRLYYLYITHPNISVRISDGDVINAAFAIAKNCSLLTIDNTDYPRLFFEETARHKTMYVSNRKKEMTDVIYLLSPDMAQVQHSFDEYNA